MAIIFLIFSYIFLTLSLIDLSLYPTIGIFSSIFSFFNRLNLFSNVGFFPLSIAFFIFSIFSFFRLDGKKNVLKAELSALILAFLICMIFFHIPHSSALAIVLNLLFCALTISLLVFADKIFSVNRSVKREKPLFRKKEKNTQKLEKKKVDTTAVIIEKQTKKIEIDDSDEYDLIDDERDEKNISAFPQEDDFIEDEEEEIDDADDDADDMMRLRG